MIVRTPIIYSCQPKVLASFRLVFLFLLFIPCMAVATDSTCFGTTSNGKLLNGVKLPAKGDNFTNYSRLAILAGRTYVHSEVKHIVVDAYESLAASQPNKVFKYTETGRRNGGPFKPHKTHQNGLSVDFMTPMIDSSGNSVHLPTHALNRLGYDIELDSKNQYEGLSID